MNLRELRTKVKNLKADIPGIISLLVFDRERNLLLYGESDDLTLPLGGISDCYARFASRLEMAHACRQSAIGKSIKRVNIFSGKMVVSVRTLSEKHMVVGECMGLRCLAPLNHGVTCLARTLEEAENG